MYMSNRQLINLKKFIWIFIYYFFERNSENINNDLLIITYFNSSDEILVTPGSIDNEECDHPLSEDPNSKWNTFFKDNQALTQIDKDVR